MSTREFNQLYQISSKLYSLGVFLIAEKNGEQPAIRDGKIQKMALDSIRIAEAIFYKSRLYFQTDKDALKLNVLCFKNTDSINYYAYFVALLRELVILEKLRNTVPTSIKKLIRKEAFRYITADAVKRPKRRVSKERILKVA